MFRSTALALLTACFSLPTFAATLTVPGTSDPWLAGMPNGSTASSSDIAPAQSPILAGFVTGGNILSFNVSVVSDVGNCGSCTVSTADGGGFTLHAAGPENGISNVNAPLNALVGMFLTNDAPTTRVAPGALDFSSGAGTSFSSLSPALQQVFFIGDGLTGTGTGTLQSFVVPTGATRLYLGTMDGYEWANNVGQYAVTVTAVPEPESSAMFLAGLAVLAAVARRKREG